VLAGVTLFLAGVVWFVLAEVQADRRRSAEAAAEIVRIQKVSWTTQDEDGMEVHEGYDISYRYRVDGQLYEGARSRDEKYRPGDTMKVCYNPGNPADHRLRPAAHTCGK